MDMRPKSFRDLSLCCMHVPRNKIIYPTSNSALKDKKFTHNFDYSQFPSITGHQTFKTIVSGR